MDILDPIIRLWQRVPSSWRKGLVTTSVAPQLRKVVNRFYPGELRIFELAGPLRGHRMRLHWQTQKAYVFGTHEPEVTGAILRTIQAGQVALDVGANIGYYTLLLAQHVGPSGKVFAFEPLPKVFAVLQENVLLNGYVNVALASSAVADCSGTVNIEMRDTDPLTSTASIASGKGVRVAAVSLDDYFAGRGERVAFVKMDVEGAEAEVLEGMKHLIQRDRPTLLIELHAFDTLGERHPALLKVKAAGYSVSFLDALGAQVHVLARPSP